MIINLELQIMQLVQLYQIQLQVTAKTTPTFNHNETPISCIGGSNGVINITNPTGIAPFTYLIKKGATTVSTTATASGLAAGTYDILIN